MPHLFVVTRAARTKPAWHRRDAFWDYTIAVWMIALGVAAIVLGWSAL